MNKEKKIYIKTCISNNNWGDIVLNRAIVKNITGINPECINKNYKSYDKVYLFAGSILGWADKKSIIWGSGFLSVTTIIEEKPLKVYAVRGKLSREKLIKQGINCPEIYGDPALIYPKFYKSKKEKKYKLGIIPHYIDSNNIYLEKLKKSDILIIDILSGLHKVIDEICSCELIASSSLHGIIAADAYNIPSIWIKFSNKILGEGFKFLDYFSSVNRKDTKPLLITEKTTLKDIYNNFYSYKIDIDLNKLYNICPLKEYNE